MLEEKKHLVIAGIEPKSSYSASNHSNHKTRLSWVYFVSQVTIILII